MKIAIMSDLHLGFRQYGAIEREQDFYEQFYKVCREINKQSPEMVIIAGDLFDKPNPSPAAIGAYREGLGLLLDCDIICTIKGNHTMLMRDNHFSIDDYFGDDEIPGYYFLDDLSMDTDEFALSGGDMLFNKYKNVKVHVNGVTYRSNSNIDEFLEVQKRLADNCSDKFYNILVVHQSFKEFCGFTGEELSIEDIDYSPYDAIICGHIHSRFDAVLSDGTKFIQPGSIERMNTTEARDEEQNGKGFYLLDSNTNALEFFKVECSRKFFLGDIELKTKEDLQKHLEELKENVSKLDVPPIISYNYKNSIKNIDDVRQNIGLITKDVLLNKSNIDETDEEEISIEITDSELPTVIEAIKLYGEKSGLTKEQALLAVDLHDALNNNEESVKGILDSYFKKHKKEEENEFVDDLTEFIEYFGE